ncbi:MAG: rhomboid family intramembrane serine protease [Bacillota bacterium]
MIPIRDTIRSRSFPAVTVTFIIINLLVFLYQASLPREALDHLVHLYGVIPTRDLPRLLDHPFSPATYIPFITAMFLHGGWFHVLGNMLYLWVFGDNVEDSMGRGRFMLFYLLVGFAGSLAHIFANPSAPIPTIGASGAVAGVLGAYFISFPRSRVLTLLPLFIFITLVEIPAVLFLVLWFGMQLLSGVASLAVTGETVAWWAHVGGFLSGALLIRFFRYR